MDERVKCPHCGQLVRANAMEQHQRFMCPVLKATGGTVPVASAALKPATVAGAHSAAAVLERLKGQTATAQSAPAPAQSASEVNSPAKAAPQSIQAAAKRRVFQLDDPIPVPPEESGFWIDDRHKEAIKRLTELSAEGAVVNVLVTGPTGCGKTTFARQFAAMNGRPFYEVHCGALVDVEQWFGKDRLIDGETVYRKNRFVQAVETAECTVLLDEINRAHPEHLNAIFGLLDWRRSIHSDDLGYTIRVAPGVVFFATMNQGVDYFGINPLDLALKDRFPRVIKLDYPPESEEKRILLEAGVDDDNASRLVQFGRKLREAAIPIPVSPRQLKVAAEELRLGASIRAAVEMSVINKLEDPTQEKTALAALQLVDPNPWVVEGSSNGKSY